MQKAREEADKQKELALTKMQQQIEKLALERSKNEAQKEIALAQIKAKQALELQKIEQAYKLKELELKKQKELLELENQKIVAQKEIELKKQFLYLSLAALVFIIVVVLIILYFYKKRKDKLIAYHDNLEKYFRLKENEAKVAIANKIIDTIAEGKLTPEQEQRLLGVLKGETKELPKEIEHKDEEPIEAEVEEKRDG
ncbi:hypothetical protein NitYY0826_C1887 [Nitratiruptor sp. YY08-26]|uniref:hypothetical protein n=1 Tax=unclassified Nitratiruptor TaxID=2624044 RepID=UPI001915ABFC|nr:MULTISPECIES: hypothetical protein [unclassified Nitratiruptor]BCD62999.1 hypothetical protein NitYY0813_C1885 [Nitratiruptor sp. YY08-13]BCD66934.1 hypothetical protein NitYY0826_C1887 [Nitratiruptor sp. YY08-26]